MKKFYILIVFLIILTPLISRAEILSSQPTNVSIIKNEKAVLILWKNPENSIFSDISVFRSVIPIADYFSYKAVEGLCDKVYEGKEETYEDTELAENLTYYYVIFSHDNTGNYSKAIIIKKEAENNQDIKKKEINNISTTSTNTLIGASSKTVNEVSLNEAGIIYNYNKTIENNQNANSRRLSLFIIVKSPHDLNEKDKNAISYFIDSGTPTTILLGSGERAGVLNSYLSVFNKLPRNILEWQDIIKIANGRWPTERNVISEEQASNISFSAIYKRNPNMDNPNDNAAVTVIAYGLRPAQRNLESEKRAIKIYKSIFDTSPTEANDWDLVRAIAYSGAIR